MILLGDASEIMAVGITNQSKLSNITWTNSGQFIVGYRLDLMPDGSGQAKKVYHWIRGTPYPGDPNWVHII